MRLVAPLGRHKAEKFAAAREIDPKPDAARGAGAGNPAQVLRTRLQKLSG